MAAVPCGDASDAYEYRFPQTFTSLKDAEVEEYAVTIVAVVNEVEKESRKTVVPASAGAGCDITH